MKRYDFTPVTLFTLYNDFFSGSLIQNNKNKNQHTNRNINEINKNYK